MEVFYDQQIFTLQKYGGISRYMYELIKRMAKMEGINVSVLMGCYQNEYGLEQYRKDFAKFYGTKMSNRVTNRISNFMVKRFAKLPFDIYHQTYYQHPPAEFSGKRIVTVHDMIHEIFAQDFPNDTTINIKKRSLEGAEGIISVSESTKRDAVQILNIPEDRIRVIPLANALTLDVRGIPPVLECPYILYVGSRWGYKNFQLLLKAFSYAKRLKSNFKLACFGGGEFTTEELQLIQQLGLGDKVVGFGGSDQVLANLYTHAALFVFPSLYEGFGIPPLEAMHYGCPVLVSNTSSIPEVVQDAGVYFDPHDVEDLVTKLELCLEDSSLRNKSMELGFAREKQFSWDKCAGETLVYYREVLGS